MAEGTERQVRSICTSLWSYRKGVAVVSALPHRLKLWKKLELEKLLELKDIVAEMSHPTVEFNCTFEKE